MKATIIFGEHATKAREKLTEFLSTFKKRGYEVLNLAESKLSLAEAVSANSLFSAKKVIFVEELSELTSKELNWLRQKGGKHKGELIIFSKKETVKSFLKYFPKETKLFEFKLPKLIFSFLESIYPGNAKRVLEALHQVAKTEADEFILHLIGKQLRDLYWVKESSETLPYPPWRISKLKFQAKRFTMPEIEKMIDALSRIDVSAKTSRTQIISSLDLLFATRLE